MITRTACVSASFDASIMATAFSAALDARFLLSDERQQPERSF